MDNDEFILWSLMPMFEEALEENEINNLAECLKKEKIISEDTNVSTVDHKLTKIRTVFDSIQTISKKGWKMQLTNTLDMLLDKQDLSTITKECFNKNAILLWILQKWYDLKEEEDLIRKATILHTKKELPRDKWLVALAHLVATGESKMVDELIRMIKKTVLLITDASSVAKEDLIATSWSYEHYKPNRHSSSGIFIIEFQAVVTKALHPSDVLHVFIKETDTFHQMQLDTRRNVYQYISLKEISMSKVSYKYSITKNGNTQLWEELPNVFSWGYKNRERTFSEDDVWKGHVIAFDVIHLKSEAQNTYEDIYEKSFMQLLPAFELIKVSENESTHIPFYAMIKMVQQWLEARQLGFSIPNPISCISVNTKDEAISRYIRIQLQRLCQTNIFSAAVRRVLSSFAYFLALASKNISLSKNFSTVICQCLSLHDLTEEEQNAIVVKVANFTTSHFGTNNLEKVIHASLEHPQCLMVIPWLELLGNKGYNAATSLPNLPFDATWKDLVEIFRKQEHQQNLQKLAEKIVPFIKTFSWLQSACQDMLSLQTTCHLLSGDQSSFQKMFDLNGIMKMLICFWAEVTKNNKEMTKDMLECLCKFILNTLQNMTEQLPQFNKSMNDLQNECLKLLEYVKRLLQKWVTDSAVVSFWPGFTARTFPVLSSIIEYSQMTLKFQDYTYLQTTVSEIQSQFLHQTLKALFNSTMHKELNKSEVELWNYLTSWKWSGDFQVKWHDACLKYMVNTLPVKFRDDAERLIVFCAETFYNLGANQTVTTCFTDVVTKHVKEKLKYTRSMHCHAKNPKILELCVKLVDKQWKNVLESIPQATNYEKVVNFLTRQGPAATLVQILGETDVKLNNKSFNDAVTEFGNGLLSGNISPAMLRKIIKNKGIFVKFFKLQKVQDCCVDFKQLNSEQFVQVIEYRQKQLEEFYETRLAIQSFINNCKMWFKDTFFVDAAAMSSKIESNVEDKKLSEVVDCGIIRNAMFQHSIPTTSNNFWEISAIENVELKTIYKTQMFSSWYCEMAMKKKAMSLKNNSNSVTVHFILNEIWIPVKCLSLEMAKNLDQGIVIMKDLHWLLRPKKTPNEPIKEIEFQVKWLYRLHDMYCDLSQSPRLDGLDKCLAPILLYHKILSSRQTVNAIQTLRTILKPTEKFPTFDSFMVRCITSCNKHLAKNSVLQKGESHENMNLKSIVEMFGFILQQDFSVLLNFVKQKDLLEWLMNNMKNVVEVEVMSDFAMTSAVETPMDVERVSCFLSAVKGFAPLLFDLPKSADWDRFIQACREVWANVKRDPSLEKKWNETALHLEWLKATKEIHGSVENSSLTIAQLINEHGMYVVGCENKIIPMFDDCLQIKILKSDAKVINDDIIMSLTELHDLKSRLMLIAGEAEKERQDVDRFVAVFSYVENLVKTYFKLKCTRCMLFNNWKAQIRCNDLKGEVTVSLTFDQTMSAITTTGLVMKELQNLTTVLNTAYNKWIHFLNEKRSKFYHLNHFNIHQITYLCKNLAVKNKDDDYNDQVYCLLSSILPDVSCEQILDNLDTATRITDYDINDAYDIDGSNESLVSKKKKVVRKLVRGELSENVAKAAVQEVKNLDLDECYLWALENEYDEEKILRLVKEFDQEIGFASNGNDIEDVISERLNFGLTGVIDMIQQSVVDANISTVVYTVCERYLSRTAVTSLSDCVSLEHLGTFLGLLGESNRKDNLPHREWPQVFVSGKPNLVVCKESDMWRNVISIYMKGEQPSLPTASEVLICSETTTSEDVELLLRRAISPQPDEGVRGYCLVCADKLGFAVAKSVEQMYQKLVQMQNKNDEYRLVILSTSSQHYISCCFDEPQRQAPFICREEEIKLYLKNQLQVDWSIRESAVEADEDRSSIRLVVSQTAGMGKSLYINRCRQALQQAFDGRVIWQNTILRFLDKSVNVDDVVETLYTSKDVKYTEPHFVHIDVTPSLQKFGDKFFFELFFLGSIKNTCGVVWKRHPNHFYAIEYTESIPSPLNIGLLELMPMVQCTSPRNVLQLLENYDYGQPLMDYEMLASDVYQRPYQYLLEFTKGTDLDKFMYTSPKLNADECLETLLKFCSIKQPSWAELYHFSSFLNTQLVDCENSLFTNTAMFEDENFEIGLSGFKMFVVKFLIRMAQDFATPSSDTKENNIQEVEFFKLHQLRHKWETDFHPYIFFNDDHETMTFVNFNISSQGNLCHPINYQMIEPQIMDENLKIGLQNQGVCLEQNFDMLSRHMKLTTLCYVFGVKPVFDPNPTYELTTDNVLKMLAIHMRFRCDIPVVIMGETGCGKSRMVEFMSKLKAGKGNDQKPEKEKIKNMVVIKVHGGITVPIMHEKVREAVHLAQQNRAKGRLETILFLDEANTTEAIYAIKEVVCDKTVHGQPFQDSGLKIIAACNPYRKHSDETIAAMEKSGRGFNVRSKDVMDKFGGIPMRHLVYRVTPLPPSMKPLVWDFGQLNNNTEEIYIRQMVLKVKTDIAEMPNVPRLTLEFMQVMTKILADSQKHMRERRDVCSFVSLRDVERTIKSFKWFYERLGLLNPMIEAAKAPGAKRNVAYAIRALIQAVGMCYHATLYDRKKYRELVSECIANLAEMAETDIEQEIIACQRVFLFETQLDNDIARNEALRENVFMIIVCAEMRIPLFLVGKPGSSKSLAKTIVTHAMQGHNSRSKLFQHLKQIHVLSFQCSAVSDAVGIETMFNQCTQLQKKQDIKKFVAVVVLDEIGLAEDSPKMPRKVLHPLLEVGSTKHTGFDVPEYNKVGFVGISNWALDPAKMNRGIFVTRGEPSKQDLRKTAAAIFQSNKTVFEQNSGIISAITDAYVEVCSKQTREFFGLRDYYALLKNIFFLVTQEHQYLHSNDISVAVLRNFSGQDSNVFKIFEKHLKKLWPSFQTPHITVVSLVQENLYSEQESRFLLLLTNQYAAVNLLKKVIKEDGFRVIFGSSFPRDHDYTEVCRNINKIKVCMESGTTVVLLNHQDLYESLYDALNQHYVTFAGQRYVDLGLGGHKVKCRIAEKFKLIVIEEKEVVYNEFSIPLINRLEKHIFDITSILQNETLDAVHNLDEWIDHFSKVTGQQQQHFKPDDAFVGYQDDTAASAVLLVENKGKDASDLTKEILLQTATLDAIVRLDKSNLKTGEIEKLQGIYRTKQSHDSLLDILMMEIQDSSHTFKLLELISFSQCLDEQDCVNLEKKLELPNNRIQLVTLLQLQTMEEYNTTVNRFLNFSMSSNICNRDKPWILLIQCPNAQQHTKLIASSKYSAINKVKELKKRKLNSSILVAFIFTLERTFTKASRTFTSFYSSECMSIYIDEMRPKKQCIVHLNQIWNMPVSQMLAKSLEGIKKKEADHFPVDIRFLLQYCIPDAMARLTYTQKGTTQNHVKIINVLCFKWKYSLQFSEMLLQHVINVMQDRESSNHQTWYLQAACDQTALEEGGSFQKTLWLRLQQLVGLVIAKLVSIADLDHNLDLVQTSVENSQHLVKIWFAFFESKHLCGIKWKDVAYGAEFTVVTKTKFFCQFPFSRLLINEMAKHWSTVAQLNIQEGNLEAFYRRIEVSSLSGVLCEAMQHGNEEDLCKRFTSDLLYILYKPFSEDSTREIEIIVDIILAVFKSKREGDQFQFHNQLLEVFTIYMEMLPKLECLGEIIASHPAVMELSDEWLETQKNSEKITTHISAFKSVLAHLDKDASDIGQLDSCRTWEKKVYEMKRVAEYIIESEDGDEELIKSWKQITFIELFLNQLVPRNSKFVNEYLKTISPLARRLWIGASKVKDFADVQFLTIITNSLKACTKTVKLKVLCNWQDVRCKACRSDKMTDPVKLACGHKICKTCIVIEEGNSSNCPICRIPVPNAHQLKPLTFTKDQKKEFELFKMSTTSLFLEYLSTFCFPSPQAASRKDNLKPPDEKFFLALENLVICDGKTQKISPYLDSFDASPTARSFILQLLLRCDKALVQDQLNQHFSKVGEVVQNRSLLVDVYIQTMQDMLLNRCYALDETIQINTTFVEDLLENALWLLKQKKTLNQVGNLDLCADLQFLSRTVVECIYLVHNDEAQRPNELKALIDKVCKKCQGQKFTAMKEYLIKFLCRKYGTDAFEILLENQNYKKCLVPPNLLPQKNKDDGNFFLNADSFALSGQVYVRTKDSLLSVTQRRDLTKTNDQIIHQVQQANDSIFQIMLALSVWAAHSNVSKDLCKDTYIQIAQKLQTHLTGRSDAQYFKDISTGALDEFKLQNLTKLTQHKLKELIILSGLVWKTSNHGLLNAFKNIISNPGIIAKSFLPTMPQSNYFDVKDVMGQEISHHISPKLYMCPNNHPYYIGECTNPVQASRCPECGEKIGGLHAGNKVGDLTEESQAGYLLKPAEERKMPVPERGMTKPSACATRACLHLALLHASRQGNDVQRALKLKSQKEVCPFLMNQLVKDIKHLAQCTGKSDDDAILLMQKIFHNMRTADGGREIKLDRMASRKQWEEAFQKEFLSLVFRDTDNIINQSQQTIVDAAKQMKNPLQRMIHEYNMADDFPQGLVEWNCPQLWKYRTHITVQHLRLKLEGVDGKGEGSGAVLKLLLNTEHLSELEHLGTILSVQTIFIQRYRHKVDIKDTDELTINQFLADTEGYMKAEIKQYIRVWNKIKQSLAVFDKYNTLREYFTENMTLDSPISMCLPSDRGRGGCALVLSEYLIEKQNDVLLKCKELIVDNPSFRQIDASSVTQNTLICISENRDLLPLILANAQYEATTEDNGPKHSIAYNLDLLEQKVEEQFILRRCLIKKETIPRMTYPQDVGLGKVCTEMQTKFEQKPLPQKICQAVDTFVKDARTADICEAVRTVTLIIQFLAKIGGEIEQSICDYAEKDLLLTNDDTAMIPRPAKICHVLALYERLSWHRTIRTINNGQNPFELISMVTDEKMTDKLTAELNEMLRQVNIERLQNELNALMMVGPELQPEWGLGEILQVYIDGKTDDADSAWCDKIPDDVCVKHAQQVFAMSIKYMVKN